MMLFQRISVTGAITSKFSWHRKQTRMRCLSFVQLLAIIAALAVVPASVVAPTAAPDTVRVAAVQFISQFGKPAENRKGLEPLVREAAGHGAKIVVLPEAAIPGYMNHDISRTWQVDHRTLSLMLEGVSPEKIAETVPGESTRELGGWAKELGIYLTVPIIEVDPRQKKYYNTLVLVGPDGRIALHYRKLNPWPWAERGWAEQGDRGHQWLDTPFGRLGLLICYDINFEPPKLKENGVDHLLYAIAWVENADSTWFAKELPAIARMANINIIGANWAVPAKPAWHGYGQSLVILRSGTVAAKAKSDLANEIIYADLPAPKKTR
jgi:predicted amidohydrolase